MSDHPMRLAARDDAGLEALLRGSAEAIAWPTASPAGAPDIAMRVRVRLVAAPRPVARWPWTAWRPVRRSLVLALVALLTLAAIAGAVGLGLPGLRLILGEPPVSPPPSVAPSRTAPPGPVGSSLRLGELYALDEVEALTGIPVQLPGDPAIGPPDAVYVDRVRDNQVAFVWAASESLPATREPGIGLILMRFEGRVDDGFRQKLIGEGTTVEPVTVDGRRGFWVSGEAHFFFYIREDGGVIDDGRRWVDDALAWTDGAVTYRLESALGRDATIELAESLE
jgi:hypothetical protein